MASLLSNSIFSRIIGARCVNHSVPVAIMGGVSGSRFRPNEVLENLPIVVFDFETTGVNVRHDRVIEIGAIKYLNRKEIDRYEQLINPGIKIPESAKNVHKITDEMLANKPHVEDVLESFHQFLRGSVGVAHNAEFDCGVLTWESERMSVGCNYTMLCTLKMARDLIKAEIPRDLASLARYYGIPFNDEERHRSIVDIRLTAQVLWKMLDENPSLKSLADLEKYVILMENVMIH